VARRPLGTLGILNAAWRSTGGVKEKIKGFDFWLAVIVVILCYPTWSAPDWPAQVTSVLPNVLGFTLGGFAVFLGFGSDSFRTLLAQSNPSSNSAFMYFVVIQIVAIMYALIATAMYKVITPKFFLTQAQLFQILNFIGAGIGYFLFVYSLATSFRAALRIYRLSRWYSEYVDSNHNNNSSL
jgi:hypothetical protein